MKTDPCHSQPGTAPSGPGLSWAPRSPAAHSRVSAQGLGISEAPQLPGPPPDTLRPVGACVAGGSRSRARPAPRPPLAPSCRLCRLPGLRRPLALSAAPSPQPPTLQSPPGYPEMSRAMAGCEQQDRMELPWGFGAGTRLGPRPLWLLHLLAVRCWATVSTSPGLHFFIDNQQPRAAQRASPGREPWPGLCLPSAPTLQSMAGGIFRSPHLPGGLVPHSLLSTRGCSQGPDSSGVGREQGSVATYGRDDERLPRPHTHHCRRSL